MIYNLMDLTSEVNLPVCGWKAISYEFQSLQLLSGKPSMPFSIPLLAAALGLAVVAVLTAGTDPAWRGASFSCVEALRHD